MDVIPVNYFFLISLVTYISREFSKLLSYIGYSKYVYCLKLHFCRMHLVSLIQPLSILEASPWVIGREAG